MKQRGYLNRVFVASKELMATHGAGFYQPKIMHDGWCKHQKKDSAPCNCFPNITVEAGGINYVVDNDGHIVAPDKGLPA